MKKLFIGIILLTLTFSLWSEDDVYDFVKPIEGMYKLCVIFNADGSKRAISDYTEAIEVEWGLFWKISLYDVSSWGTWVNTGRSFKLLPRFNEVGKYSLKGYPHLKASFLRTTTPGEGILDDKWFYVLRLKDESKHTEMVYFLSVWK